MKVTPLDTPNHKSPSAPCTLCSSPGDRLSSLCKPQAALATLGLPGPALKDAGSPPCLSVQVDIQSCRHFPKWPILGLFPHLPPSSPTLEVFSLALCLALRSSARPQPILFTSVHAQPQSHGRLLATPWTSPPGSSVH